MLREAWYITERELKHFIRRKVQVITSLIQPVVWLAFFGFALSSGIASLAGGSLSLGSVNILQIFVNLLPVDYITKYILSNLVNINYITYLATGMIAYAVMSTAFISGISVIWDKRFGFFTKMLAAPIPRSSIILGKMIAAMIRSLIQAVVVIAVAVLLGVKIYTGIIGIALAIPFLVIFALGLAGISTAAGIRMANVEAFFGIIQMILLPLFFVSPAITSLSSMPGWLQTAAQFNPLTYAVDAVRSCLLGGQFGPLYGDFAFIGVGGSLLYDLAILSLIFVGMVLIGAYLFRRSTT
ncbi:MAG: ABC transporter permease [Candidatus Freyarchaeum deiterrae]